MKVCICATGCGGAYLTSHGCGRRRARGRDPSGRADDPSTEVVIATEYRVKDAATVAVRRPEPGSVSTGRAPGRQLAVGAVRQHPEQPWPRGDLQEAPRKGAARAAGQTWRMHRVLNGTMSSARISGDSNTANSAASKQVKAIGRCTRIRNVPCPINNVWRADRSSIEPSTNASRGDRNPSCARTTRRIRRGPSTRRPPCCCSGCRPQSCRTR